MRLFNFFKRKRNEIHAGAGTTTSLAYHMEHTSEKPFVFQSPPVPAPKIYTVPTYMEYLEGEVQKAKSDLSYSFGDFHDSLSNDLAQERVFKAQKDLDDYRSEIEMASKTPFTKDDIKTKEGEFDKLKDMLKDNQLETDIARADFYCSPHSQEDVEYADSYDEMKCAEFCEKHTENEIDETQGQINHMNQTLDDNHTKLVNDWGNSNEIDNSGHEPER